MKACAIDQSGLKCLQLLPGDDVVVNIDNHDEILSMESIFTYQRAPSGGKPLNWSTGVVEG
jgi:hypothetical protein